jgi:hypothetical protein
VPDTLLRRGGAGRPSLRGAANESTNRVVRFSAPRGLGRPWPQPCRAPLRRCRHRPPEWPIRRAAGSCRARSWTVGRCAFALRRQLRLTCK